MKTTKLLKKMRDLEADHAPNKYPPVRMSEISALCDLVENAIPSIKKYAVDLLQDRLERGEYLAKQDDLWWLFQANGEGVIGGKTLRDILISLIFIDC